MRGVLGGRRGMPPELYKAISLLVQYPDQRLLEAAAEIAAEVETLPPSPAREAVRRFLRRLSTTPPDDLAHHYVETFDLAKECSPYLTYFVHGDTRERGTALLRLQTAYRSAGLQLQPGELPDHLAVVLEFAAFAPREVGAAVLAELRPGLELLRQGLRRRGSPYLELLEALCGCLPRMARHQGAAVDRLAQAGPPTERVGLEPYGTGARPASQEPPR